MWYDVVVTVFAVGFVVCYRLGIRDTLRMMQGKQPEKIRMPKIPVARQEAAPPEPEVPEDEALQEQLKAIDQYDGWKV